MSQAGSPRNNQGFRRLGAWMAALALVVQVLLVQPHVDVAFSSHPEAQATAHVSGPSDHGPVDCIICHAFAVAGFATLADAPSLGRLSHSLLDITPAERAAEARVFPAHHWLSRGPPSL